MGSYPPFMSYLETSTLAARATSIYDAYRYFATSYNANHGVERIEVNDFAKNLDGNKELIEFWPMKAVVRVFRIGGGEASSTVIVFADAANFIVSVTDALHFPETNMSESSRVLMFTAAMETLYRLHKKEIKRERGEKRDDGCTIT